MIPQDAQDDVINLVDLFDACFWVGKVYRIWTPKRRPSPVDPLSEDSLSSKEEEDESALLAEELWCPLSQMEWHPNGL